MIVVYDVYNTEAVMTHRLDHGGLRVLPPIVRCGMPIRVNEYVNVYRLGQPVALPVKQPGAIKSNLFVGPNRQELAIQSPGAVRIEQGAREIVADPTLDPRKR